MNDAEKESLAKIVEDAASNLAEHFDSVRIFTTKHGDQSDGSTFRVATGRGNYYAGFGQVQEWITMQDQTSRDEASGKDE